MEKNTSPGQPVGRWLFRYRSWIPPLLLAGLVAVLWLERDARAQPGLAPPALAAGLICTLAGLAIRAYVIGTAAPGTSGRNTLSQVAKSLNTTGLYSIVRHPLYLGNFFTWIGLAIATGSWWALPVTIGAFGLFYGQIILVEEAFLRTRFGEQHATWASVTPALVPALSQWRPPRLPFAPRIVLRQEYYGWFTAVVFFAVLEIAAQYQATGRVRLAAGWLVALTTVGGVAGTLRVLQRKTSLLDVEGR